MSAYYFNMLMCNPFFALASMCISQVECSSAVRSGWRYLVHIKSAAFLIDFLCWRCKELLLFFLQRKRNG